MLLAPARFPLMQNLELSERITTTQRIYRVGWTSDRRTTIGQGQGT